MLARPALMKEVERTNVAIVNLQQQQIEFASRCDLYAIDVDRGRNCYNCRSFGHIIRNCKNWKIIGQERRIDYKNNGQINLNRKESLVVLD